MVTLEYIEKLCKAVAEMAENCGHDLVGEHRKNYNPRIERAFVALVQLFPVQMAKAIAEASLFE